MTIAHLLTVTSIDRDYWEADWEITCLGVDNSCRLWQACPQCDTPDNATLRDHVARTGYAHGQPHQIIDGHIMYPTDHCYLTGEPDWSTDSIYDLILHGPVDSIGTYLIDHDYQGDRHVEVALAAPTPVILDRLTAEQHTALLLTAATR